MARVLNEKISAIIYLPELLEFLINFSKLIKEDKIYFSPEIDKMINNKPNKQHHFLTLTLTELKVARLLVQGYKTKEIGSILFISPFTVSDHRKHIKEKLQIPGGKGQLLQFLNNYISWLFIVA